MLKERLPYMTGEEYATVTPAIKRFEREVWFKHLFEHVNSTKCRCQSGRSDGLSVMAWTCAGRTMISITDLESGHWLSLVVADDSKESTMGLHERSVDAGTMLEWMRRVEENWGGIQDDQSVTLDVLADV